MNNMQIDGATVVARALKIQDVKYVFGIVGIPIHPVMDAVQKEGIQFIGCRNEQTASYAAALMGYVTGKPGVCMVASGPGFVNSTAGLAYAAVNCFPMVLIAGSSDTCYRSMDAFQEWPQIETANVFQCKLSVRPSSTERIPFYMEKTFRVAVFGRPGPTYLDLPGNFINMKINEKEVDYGIRYPDPSRPLAEDSHIEKAMSLLMEAKRPLILIGKGAAYSRAENEIHEFIKLTGIPFFPTPMGKGVLPDEHKLCVIGANTAATKEADLILLVGVRLNWVFDFGSPARFNNSYKIIQIDICAEELNNNRKADAMLHGDIRSVVDQLNRRLQNATKNGSWTKSHEFTPWIAFLKAIIHENTRKNQAIFTVEKIPMNYYRAFDRIRRLLPHDCVLVTEGSRTMEIGRFILPNFLPRRHLDSGSHSTMGVGMACAMVGALTQEQPGHKTICVQGDSAFGFSGMDLETCCRLNLPIVFVIINNDGVYGGIDPEEFKELREKNQMLPVTSLTPRARYELMAEAFGGKGFLVQTPKELSSAFKEALQHNNPVVINVLIDPHATIEHEE